jgi:DNA-binding GntR family transcriptional regulator
MAVHIDVEPMSIRSALARLIGLALIDIKPGSGAAERIFAGASAAHHRAF